MTRVYHPRPQYAPQRSGTLEQPRAVAKKKKPYKIVLEAVTQEKKKLHSILTYASNAPTGFGFIPAGHPEFTEWCKEQCRQRNLDVHIVSAKPKNKMHSDPEKLSHHVHRVGHHFPLQIIDLACSKFGYTYDESQGLQKAKDGDRTNWIARRFEDYSSRQVKQGRPTTEKETKGYIHGAVREMFPKIPDDDLQAIVTHAFEEGTNRVGNAKELSLARRVQLAVVAHIRHTYTDYDKLLKSGGWMEARSKVESVSLAKLKEWRDEADEQSNELEETFREVIVLDDDDEPSSERHSTSTPDEREQSMEIVSSRATAHDLQPELHANYPRNDMRGGARRTIVLPRYLPPRSGPLPGSSHPQPFPQLPPPPMHATLNSESRLGHHGEAYRYGTHNLNDKRARPAESGSSQRAEPILHEIDGQLYKLQPIKEPQDDSMMRYDLPPSRRIQGMYSRPASPRFSVQERPPTSTRRMPDHDLVLPSVERETVDLTSPPRRNTNAHHPVQDHNMLDMHYTQVQSPKRKAPNTFADERDTQADQQSKRSRPMYREELHPRAYQGGPLEFHSSQPMGPLHSAPRPPPPEHVVDLINSPYGPPTNNVRGHYEPPRPTADVDPRGYVYAPPVTHRQPARDVREPHYQVPAGAPCRTYVPNARAYDSRDPARDYISLRDGRQIPRFEEESLRYMRTGVRYGA
ncbi:hypothetical protein COCC4DRAFT_183428 [Bipolaris maydis ATCC 48331]|uniref:DUF2293 domain-containing protein n=2 Tax=Cochliobolus heterostrophus TaxID=5016 RepID=M2UQ63_COCH5|nr:uncharacterized protein COCC4DRAFT_183428 [Bipolaris maydis ATCC 48331]EMD95726.1 hypothetical protein COCHEDRAFT_1190924 [Bipolaris maydis C5]KAH7561648.1 hypothetical protein BM1_02752 [Bipolaris maydis]ENI10586.1 hypothetical protein COCC4DRAFT_183428 [Bipolaris maydis ATCC 48331]KAJ5030459.1 hypothetical protein J3E73DRAFT_420571 [Bipolaris maydis]KAJ5065469.1 hypothetical protein J3E74DRAFT_260301 [Bipolaris maydis]